jgi:diguanylate cyclase (GGDEF)-like protein
MQQTLEEIHPPSSQAVSLGYFTRLFADLAAGRPPSSFRGELEYLCKDGSTIWTEVMAHPILSRGQLVEILGVTRDISEHKRLVLELRQAKEAAEQANAALQHANAELAKIATTDVLTGIWNRRHFLEMAGTLKLQASRYGHPLSLLLLDIDHFKSINDRHGHPTGDQVLIELTRRLQPAVRGTDVLARWGGEEFVLLSPGCGAHEAVRLAEKLRARVAELPFAGVGGVTISLGAAELQPDETIDSLFKRVDTALYEAKAAGRNTVRAG